MRPHFTFLRLAVKASAAFAAVLLLLAPAARVAAHPADMYAQNLTVTVAPDSVRIDWQILPGPFLADAVWVAADLDQSGSISAPEAEAWIAPFVSSLSVQLGGKPLLHETPGPVHWPSTVDVLRTAEDRISLSLQFAVPANTTGEHALEIHASHLEANSLIWFSLTADAGLSFEQPRQDNGLLAATIRFPDQAAPAAAPLRSWNSATPNLTGFATTVSQLASGLTDQAQSPQTPQSQAGSVTSTLTGLVKTRDFSPLFLAGAFLLSMVLGSLHTLTPGHGKALVGAYLVGSQGKTRDAVILGGIVTLTHTGSVVLLGLVTLFASHYILPALIAPWLEIISGLLVIAFGVNLLFQRRRDLALHGQDHHHDHTHSHTHLHPRPEALDARSPGERPAAAPPQVTFRSLLTLGISGGLVPCPDAIAILLVAVAINRIPFGMLLIVSFSIGLALVLIGIGIAMVNGARLMARSDALSRFGLYAPVVSAVVVMGLGAALTVSALNSLRFGSAVARSAADARAAVVSAPRTTRLLYIASDSKGWGQLFMRPLSGGGPVQYTQEPSGVTGYSISPDQETILYTLFNDAGGTAIWALSADGGGRRLALDCPRSECNSPRWYPDGRRIAYERLDDATEATVPRFSIWWLDLSTGATQPVFQDPSFASYAPQFSPDGKWLSYVSSADNMLILYNLSDARSLSVPLGLQAALPASWSPDGTAVLFGSETQDGRPLRVKTFALSSEEITDLGGPDTATDYSAAWSPDGAWIAIDRNVPIEGSSGSNQVWLVKPDGTQAHALLEEAGASYSSLNWSPDSRYLLYARYVLDLSSQTPGHFDIYMTNIQTGESSMLVTGGDMPALLP